MTNINIIKFLRGIAALFVIVYHCVWLPGTIQSDWKSDWFLYTPCWVGVWIFFILSGYLLGKGFVSEKYKTNSIKDFLIFYLQRAIRILPIYFFIIFIDLFFVNTGTYFNLSTEVLKRSFTLTLRTPYLTPMNGNMWFICTLFQLYILAPIIYKFILKPINFLKYRKLIFYLLIFGLITSEFIMRISLLGHISWGEYIYPNVIFNLDFFFGGFILNFLINTKTDSNYKKFLRPISFGLFIIFSIYATYIQHEKWMLDIGAEIPKVYIPVATILISALLLYAFDLGNTKQNQSFRMAHILNPVKYIEYISTISMGLFICHCQTLYNLTNIIHFDSDTRFYINPFDILNHPISITFSYHCKNTYTILLMTLLISIIWGLIIYYLLEKPINKYRKTLMKI